MLKEAIAYLRETAEPKIIEVAGRTFSVDNEGSYQEIKHFEPRPETIKLSSLDALVKVVRRESSGFFVGGGPLYISVGSCDKISCFTSPIDDLDCDRVHWYTVEATDIPGWDATVKMPFDQAAVALQTRFQDTDDKQYTLTLLSQITTGAKVTYNDIGVATTVVTQRGVSLQTNSTIKPLVKLRPYRTFQEVEQPEGLFLIRIDERGITFTEADGGMWRLQARKTAKAFLEEQLKDLIESGSVVVMM